MRKIGEIKGNESSRITIGFTEIIRKLIQFKVGSNAAPHFAQFELEVVPKGELVLSKIEIFTSCDDLHFDTTYCHAFKDGLLDWLESVNRAGNGVENFILKVNEIIIYPTDPSPLSFKSAICKALNIISNTMLKKSKKEKPNFKIVDLPNREDDKDASRKVS